MFNQAAYYCSHYFFCTHLHLIKPQSLGVESAAYMFYQAAYSCTHYCLLSHHHIMKPQSLQVRSSANMFNKAAFSCTHYFRLAICEVNSNVDTVLVYDTSRPDN